MEEVDFHTHLGVSHFTDTLHHAGLFSLNFSNGDHPISSVCLSFVGSFGGDVSEVL